ncbi:MULTISPECIES: thioesterase II family protein [unclassified Streptomyces]|uniref:thioesterase II family protein n=1 Tax=unclassified Streptomyces TaxID=2593676 RepID=UPI002E14D12A|nr:MULTISPECIES: thioesterase domain-containing protein [unclassified Streptomyces]WSR19850.1 thioesterase domain-containing protein [Streptomyces sp. NBC_01207]WTA24015.1 thioesterase domain-containing protein [Streptomyces sp. NBC_00853]
MTHAYGRPPAGETTPDEVGLIQIRQPALPSSYRMICFPSSRNSPLCYLAMAELLLPTVELLIVQYPSLSAEEELDPAACELLADKVFEAVRGWTDRPFALFGHRMGAELAYAVGCRLERETYGAPLTLFVSGRTAPGHRGSLGPPALSCRVVALTAQHDQRAALAGVRGWRRCTSGSFDLEVFPGAQGYLKSHRREVVNIVHDQLISLGEPDPD